jgi:hypothetical protein
MALKFKCPKCDAYIITKFLKVGEVSKCRSCGTGAVVPENASEIDEEPKYAIPTVTEPEAVTKVKGKVRPFAEEVFERPEGLIVLGLAMGLNALLLLWDGASGLSYPESWVGDQVQAASQTLGSLCWILAILNAGYGYGLLRCRAWARLGPIPVLVFTVIIASVLRLHYPHPESPYVGMGYTYVTVEDILSLPWYLLVTLFGVVYLMLPNTRRFFSFIKRQEQLNRTIDYAEESNSS